MLVAYLLTNKRVIVFRIDDREHDKMDLGIIVRLLSLNSNSIQNYNLESVLSTNSWGGVFPTGIMCNKYRSLLLLLSIIIIYYYRLFCY